MRLYFNIGFGFCAKLFMKSPQHTPYVPDMIVVREMMVKHMQEFIVRAHGEYIHDIFKYKIYKFKKLES